MHKAAGAKHAGRKKRLGGLFKGGSTDIGRRGKKKDAATRRGQTRRRKNKIRRVGEDGKH